MTDGTLGRKKKIAIFANTYWYIYKFRSTLIRELENAGYEVIACAAPDDEYRKRVSVRTVPFSMDRHSLNPFKELKSFLSILFVLMKEQPDCVLTYTPKLNLYAALSARLSGTPYIVNISGVGKSFSMNRAFRSFLAFIYRVSLGQALHVFFQNRTDMDFFISNRLVGPSHSRIYGSGVDLTHYIPKRQVGSLPVRTFLFAARMIKEKGILDFLAAAKALKAEGQSVRFICCGAFEGDDIKDVVLRAHAEGVVSYLGLVDDMRVVLEETDCVVLPTYYNEGVPRILIEAIAMGRPVISTPLSGCLDVVVDGVDGFVIPPMNPQTLANAMGKIASIEKSALDSFSRAGMDMARTRFNEQVIIQEYLAKIASMATR